MKKTEPKKENMLLNLLLNIVIPTVILIKFSSENYLGAQLGVVVALAFPIGYGIMDYFRERKINLFSALGVISVFLTGGISLLELDPKYIAIKEASIPGLIAIAVLISTLTPYPLVKVFLYNDKIMQIDRVNLALAKHQAERAFQRALSNASLLLAASFVLSSVLNYLLAKWIVVSQPGTEQFNAELGELTALSFPVIALPSTIIMMAAAYYVYRRITGLTGLSFEEIFNIETEDNEKDQTPAVSIKEREE